MANVGKPKDPCFAPKFSFGSYAGLYKAKREVPIKSKKDEAFGAVGAKDRA